MLYEEKIIDTIPVGPLGLIPLKSCRAMGEKVDKYLTTAARAGERAQVYELPLPVTREIPILFPPARRDLDPERERAL